jgi:peptidyl-tRNA hydrolase, PTH1 family
MTSIIVGLGNPGPEYEKTRHNAGRIMLEAIRKKFDFPEWESSKKYKALVSKGEIGGESVVLLAPETFMNKSGQSVAELVKSVKAAERLVVIYDELDLPMGKLKMVFNRGSGGHKGIESIVRALKTEAFVRIRIGISPATPSGKLKKPQGDEKVQDFILGSFKPAELETLKKISKKVIEAVEICVAEGREKAMNVANTN